MTTDTHQKFINYFQAIAFEAHCNSRHKGFWDVSDKLRDIAEKEGMKDEMMQMRKSQLRDLMHSELGEACEGDRKNLASEKIPGFTNVEEEYADLIIRLMDAGEGLGLKLPQAIIAKMQYNSTRLAMHGGKAF